MNHIALAQNVLGQGLRIGHGIVGGEEEEPASYRDFQPTTSIFREGEVPPGQDPAAMPPVQEQVAQPQPLQENNGGLFKIFKRKR